MADRNTSFDGLSAGYLEQLYEAWRTEPGSVDPSWRGLFESLERGRTEPLDDRSGNGRQAAADGGRAQSNVASLIYAYRSQGHLIAQFNPIEQRPTDHPALALESFGLERSDLEREFDPGHIEVHGRLPLREILALLRDTYCRSIGVEYIHIQDRQVRRWLQEQMEPILNRPAHDPQRKRRVLEQLVDAELLETFIHSRYPGQKRFSLEGAESLIPTLHAFVGAAAEAGVAEIVMGMAHRGRLNVLVNLLGMSHESIFSEFEGNFQPESVQGDGDVKYHVGYSTSYRARHGRAVHLSLTANPSHLEAVYPVVEGRVRAKQRQHGDTKERRRVIPLVLHGDAAFAGQGVVAETLNLSQLPGYRTGGTVHIVINNQIGFTTSPMEARSTVYSTDVAKVIEAPIFHVNGDDPEAMIYVADLALRFRQQFNRDVVIDMVCYRRHGHNEGDEPAFTQPLLYRQIRDRPSVRRLYARQLIEEGHLTEQEAERLEQRFTGELQLAHDQARQHGPGIEVQAFERLWKGLDGPFTFDPVATGVERSALVEVARALCTVPEGFKLNPKVARRLPKRLETVEDGGEVDWGFAELLAFGTLLSQGVPVRLSGQDSARGTFSHRHAVWQDVESAEPYTPLRNIHGEQERFCVYNSTLSEASVLGFEYGYAMSEPRMLIIWEAQFGDFANGAQVMIDQFITGAESKWQRDSGIVMLLPHGYEGQGPEHSNAYLERYLMACAEDNVQVCNVTTPAQYFHLLRRQVLRSMRLPLIVMAPKSLLRHPRCVSPVDALLDGTFQEVLADPAPPARARRVVLCCGKVYYDLLERREAGDGADVALVRLEQLYPLHEQELRAAVEAHAEASELVWAQEEPQNRGAWSYMMPRLLRMFGERQIAYVGRDASASPATGSLSIHRAEQERLVRMALEGELEHDDVSGGVVVQPLLAKKGNADG